MLTGFNNTKVIIVIFLDVDEHHADTDGHLDDDDDYYDNDDHHGDNDGYPDDHDDFSTDWYWPLSANTSRTSFSQVAFNGYIWLFALSYHDNICNQFQENDSNQLN